MADYFVDYNGKITKNKKKKKQTTYTVLENGKVVKNDARSEESDIAPVKTDEDQKWYQGWLKKGEGNFEQNLKATGIDLAEDFSIGVVGSGEKILDALMTIGPTANAINKVNSGEMLSDEDWKEHDKQKKEAEEFIKKDLYDEEEVVKNKITNPFEKKTGIDVESMSVLGSKTDSLVQSGGQMVTSLIPSAINPLLGTSILGATSFGAEMENALNNGATYDEAMISSTISAGAEILTEKISGAIKLGGKTLDEIIPVEKLAQGISNKLVRNLINIGVDATGEGLEEIVSGYASAIGQKLTYMDEKEIKELFSSEDKLESFLGGAILGGVAGSVTTAVDTAKGKDSLTGMSGKEKAVFDKLYSDAVKERSKDDKKLSQKDKNKIYDENLKNLEKGYVDTDIIESTLGGKTYEEYKKLSEEAKEFQELYTTESGKLSREQQRRLDELEKKNEVNPYETAVSTLKDKLTNEVRESVKGNKLLEESYNEKARKSQKYEADLTKYDTNQQAVIKSAIDSGVLNNTNKTHDFVDFIANLTADKEISFDFANNDKIKASGFSIEGKTINGYVQGSNIVLNVDSTKALNTVVGHEITHILEGTELYSELQTLVEEYAKTKGEYDSRMEDIVHKYRSQFEGKANEERLANYKAELTADLVGDYLFTDADFVNNLSATKPNVFKRVYDEIKYLCKVATTGSTEEKKLLEIKRTFEKAYQENVKPSSDEKYSFAGINSTKANEDSLTKARDMSIEGFDAEKIRQETGWHQGYDGKWRYEIDDSKMEILETESESPNLNELIKHDELFESYPYLNHVYIEYKDMNVNGRFNSEYSTIEINNKLRNDKEQLKKTLIHEIQHAIQMQENFASGSSPEYWSKQLEKGYDSRTLEVRKQERELQEKYAKLKVEDSEFVSEMENLDRMTPTVERGAIDWETLEQIEEDPIEWQEFDAERERLVEKHGEEKVFDFMDLKFEMSELKTKRTRNEKQLYHDTAGEIEARETANRLTFDETERKKYQPRNKRENIEKDNVVFARYSVSEDADLYNYIQDALNDKLPKKSYYKLSDTISDRMAKDIEDIVGFSVEGYGNEISPSSIKHIGKRHGASGKGDSSIVDSHELAKISYVIETYDQIREGKVSREYRNSDGSYAKTVELQKKIDDNFYYIVEAVPDSTKKTLHVVSAYKNKKDTFSDVLVSNDPKRYVQDEHRPNVSSNYIIPENAENTRGSATFGEYRVYGKDIAFEEATANDIAPKQSVASTVSEQIVTTNEEERDSEMAEAPLDEMQVLYSLEEEQNEKIAEVDNVVTEEDTVEASELPDLESFNTKLSNYRSALEGYKTARETIETSFDDVINKKMEEYDGLKRKDTNRATTLLMQIENLRLRKDNNITTLDSKITKVESTIEKLENGIPTRRQIYHRNLVDNIKNTFTNHGFDFDSVLDNAKDKGTFASVDNTPQRFIEKSLGYKEGQILNDLTVNKVAQNESEGIKWLNSFTDKKSGELAKISKEYGIKPRSKESASAQMYAEGFWVDDDGNFIKYGDEELAKDYPNEKVRENIKKLAKDERVRKIYDETLEMINESRKQNLYPEIPKRKNYFLHFREMDDTFSRLGIPFNPNDIRMKDLPTDINGMTADLQPGQPYFASAKQRIGYKTTYDLLGGVERYLNSAKNQIYHIDDIQTLRALRNYIAERFGQAKGLENLDSMDEAQALERIEQVYNSHLSTFAKFLNEEANVLAGKTSLVDRALEGTIGRRGIQFLNTVNRQVGSNMVGGNISSALTNTVSMVQAVAKSNKFDSIKAFAQMTSNMLNSISGKTDGFAENNPMMIRRKGVEKLTRTPWESIVDKGYILASAVDNISSEFIVRTKFNELTRKGMSEQQAHIEADKWASRILGDRSLGQQPLLYNSKMLGLVTKFQLEVRNQLDSQYYDTIQEAKVSTEEIENKLMRNMTKTAKIGSAFVQLAVLQHIFGQTFEKIAGYNPAFDIVEVMAQMIGLDDDEESEDTVLDNFEQGFLALLEDLPYTSTFTGGRIPIASALPIEQFITGKDDYGNEKSRWETIKETAPYYLMPTGYGQIKKTKAGREMFSEEHPIAGSYTKSGNLRFPVEDTPLNRLQANIFGQYASKNARDYFDDDKAPLKSKQIQEFKELDIPIQEYWEIREGLSDLGSDAKLTEQGDYIGNLDLPISKQNILINNLTDREKKIDMSTYKYYSDFEEFDFATRYPEKYKVLQEQGISVKDYNDKYKETAFLYTDDFSWASDNMDKYTLSKAVTDNLIEYKKYTSDLNDIKADKDKNGKTINGSAKKKKTEYINSLDLDYGQKIILYRSLYDSKEDKNKYDSSIVDYLYGRSDISYEDMEVILKELGIEW